MISSPSPDLMSLKDGQHCPPASQLKQDISKIFNKSDENELKLEDGVKKLIL